MANPFDQFDAAPAMVATNPFDQFDPKPAAPAAAPEDGPSAVGAFARGAEAGALPAAGGIAGAGAAMAGAAATGLPEAAAAIPVAGPIIAGGLELAAGAAGAFGGGAVIGKAQQWVLDHAPPEIVKALGLDKEQQVADEAAHPYARFAGELAPNLAAFRPGAIAADVGDATRTTAQKLMANPVTARALPAAVMGAQEAASEEIDKGDLDPSKIAIAAGVGALSNKMTKVGDFLTGAGAGPVMGLQAALRNRGRAEPDAGMVDITPKGPEPAPPGTPRLEAPIDPQDIQPGDAESPIPTSIIAAGRKIAREATTPIDQAPENNHILSRNGWPNAGTPVTIDDGEGPTSTGTVQGGFSTAHPETGEVGDGLHVTLDTGEMFSGFKHEIDAAGIKITPQQLQQAGLPLDLAALPTGQPQGAAPAAVPAGAASPVPSEIAPAQATPQPIQPMPADLFVPTRAGAAPAVPELGTTPAADPIPAAPTVPRETAPPTTGDGTQAAPIVVTHPDHVEQASDLVNTAPTEAQKEAGNYAKGHITVQGLPITIENPAGSVRSGTGPEGPWSVKMPAAYGYIKRTTGADNEQVDAYVGPNPTSPKVFVIDQKDAKTGAFDEHKVMLGMNTKEQALATYHAAFSDGLGPQRVGGVQEMNTLQFKKLLNSGTLDKPLTGSPTSRRASFLEAANKGLAELDALQKAASAEISRLYPEGGAPTAPKAILKTTRAPLQPNTESSVLQNIRGLGGIKTRGPDGQTTKEGQDILAALKDVKRPGLINNISGVAPDRIRESMKEAGWFGSDPEAGNDIQDLYDLIDKEARQGPQYHPDSDRLQSVQATAIADDNERHLDDIHHEAKKAGEVLTPEEAEQISANMGARPRLDLESAIAEHIENKAVRGLYDRHVETADPAYAAAIPNAHGAAESDRSPRQGGERLAPASSEASGEPEDGGPASGDTGEAAAAEPEAAVAAPVAGQPRAPKTITLPEYDEAAKRFRAGDMTAAEAKQHFEDLVASSGPIKIELRAYPKDHLAKMDPRNRNESKIKLADSIYSSMLNTFNAKGTYQWSPFAAGGTESGPAAGILRAMADQTDQHIKDYAEERKQRIADRQQTYTDPQTLTQFRDFISMRGIDKLTSEQRARYDAMVADDTRGRAEREKSQKQTVQKVELGDVKTEIVETKHTQKGHALFVVKLSERVERDTYDRLVKAARSLGGNYSSYARDGAVPGYQFRTREAAEKFIALKDGDVSKADLTAQREADVKGHAVERLRAMADKMTEDADDSINADRKVNTARRANQAAGAEASAAASKALAVTMRNLADAIEGGDVRYLDAIRTRSDVETLGTLARRAQIEWARAEQKRDPNLRFEKLTEGPVTAEMIDKAPYPWPNAHRETALDLARIVENKAGYKRDAIALRKMAEDALRHGDWLVRAENLQTQGILHSIAQEVGKGQFGYRASDVLDSFKDYGRLQRMGLSNPPTMRAALREFLQYRGSAAKADPIKAAERALVGTKIPGYFPTPPRVIDKMIDAAGIEDGMSVLEPSAGKGNIFDRLPDAAKNLDISAIEPQASLRKILEMKGAKVVAHDFLEYDGKHDRIVMNPPFEDRQDVAHVQHAYDLLNPGGRVVAIMSEGPFFGTDKRAEDFRNWLESVGGTSEKLPQGSFIDSERSTGVATRLVTIDKEEAADAKPMFSPRRGERDGDMFAAEPGTAVDGQGRAVPQTVIPGAERDAVQLAKAREAQGRGKSTTSVTQKAAGPLFGEEPKEPEQGALFQPQTISPEFKRWFGDSKVADESGKPLRVFHGTPRGDFDMFDTYAANYGLMGQGGYFTEDPEVASSYTSKGAAKMERRGEEVTQTVYPAYLKVERPLDMEAPADKAAWGRGFPDEFEAFETLPDGATNEQAYRNVEDALKEDSLPLWEGAERMQGGIREMGHDGITHIGGGRVADGPSHRVWIVFDPEQVKSAVGNRGTFDPADARIAYSPREGRVTGVFSPEFAVQREAIGAELRARLDSMGLKDIALKLPDTVMADDRPMEGAYMRKIIAVSLDTGNPVQTLDHEAIHAMKDMGLFSKTEWSMLAKAAAEWRTRFDVDKTWAGLGLDEDRLNEESVAEAYRDWRAGQKEPGIIERIFNKVRDTLAAIRDVLLGRGFRTPEDIFAGIRSGRVGNRPRQEGAGEDAKFSAHGDEADEPPDEHQAALDHAWDATIAATAKKLGWDGEPTSKAMFAKALMTPKGPAKTELYRNAGVIKTMEEQRATPLRPSAASTIKGTGETKTRGLSEGIADKAGIDTDLPEYETMSRADQLAKATQYDASPANRAAAEAAAMGTEAPPFGITPEAMLIAVENRATREGDADLLLRLATRSKLVKEATEMGQRISMLGERDPLSPVNAIKEVQAARQAANKGKGTDAPKAKKDAVKDMLAAIKKETANTSPGAKKLNLRAFAQAIACKE